MTSGNDSWRYKRLADEQAITLNHQNVYGSTDLHFAERKCLSEAEKAVERAGRTLTKDNGNIQQYHESG